VSRTGPSLPTRAAALLLVLLYALALLAIGLREDWRLLHEDNGAWHTSLAMSHLTLGLAATRAHSVFFNPATGESYPYAHHPPGPALILAAAFSLSGSAEPAVARGAAILFQLASLLLLVRLLRRFFTWGESLVGSILFASLPMAAYFGRVVNYEVFCLPFVLLQLDAWVEWRRRGSRGSLARLCAGALLGAFMDWPSLFFTAALVAVELLDGLSRRPRTLAPAGALAAIAAGSFVIGLAHLAWAGRGGLRFLLNVLSKDGASAWRFLTSFDFLLGQLETYRLYFTHVAFVAGGLALFGLIQPRRGLSPALFEDLDGPLLRRLLAATGGAGVIHCLAAPYWADLHSFWQFYLLPFTVIAILLLLRLLWRRAIAPGRWQARALLGLCVVDLLFMSSNRLHARHTRESAYAIRTTAEIRARAIPPPRPGEKAVWREKP
jgi:hypothetical protein